MTNDEIRHTAEMLYVNIAREVGKGGAAVQIPMIERTIREAVSQAYEEAAELCAEGSFQIGCTALEAEGVVRRTRIALAEGIRALKGT